MKVRWHRVPGVVFLFLLFLGGYLSIGRKVAADPQPVACSNTAFSFALDTPFSTTTSTSQGIAAAGDLNGDGKPDLVTANTDGTVSVLLGNGAGQFVEASGSPLVTGGYADAVVLTDLDGDGDKDIAVAVAITNKVHIFLNDGIGSFSEASASPFTVGNIPDAIGYGDFDGNGIPDLAVANRDSNNITILIGNGGGTGNFHEAAGSPIAIAPGPVSIAIADVTGDGRQDIVAGSHLGAGALTILQGNGSGAFSAIANSPFDLGFGPVTSVRVGDFNGDGKPDIVSAHPTFHALSLLLGNGAGAFSAPATFSVGSYDYSLDIGDFNGDGNLDVATANWFPNSTAIFLGNGSGGLTEWFGSPIPLNVQPAFILVTDLSGDGRQDIAIANAATYNVYDLLNTCTAFVPPTLGNYPNVTARAGGRVFSQPDANPTGDRSITATASPGFTGSLWVNQFNGRVRVRDAGPAGTYTIKVTAHGHPDVSKSFQLTVLDPINCSNSSFAPAAARSVSPGVSPFAVAVGDFDIDGGLDLATANIDSNDVTILMSDSNAHPPPIPVGAAPRAILVDDFNGDGFQDIVTANSDDADLSLMLGNGDDEITFHESPYSHIYPGGLPFTLAKGDLNNDGRDDIVTANFIQNNIGVLLATPAGGFTLAPGAPVAVGNHPLGVAVGDFNGDGKADIVSANNGSGNVSILLGNGDGTFVPAPVPTVPVAPGPRSVVVGDFNSDGKQDLATVNVGSGSVTILLGNGAGGFAEAAGSPIGVGAAPQNAAIGDFNGDGHQDLAAANRDSNDLTILSGNGMGGFSPIAGSPFTTGQFPRDVVMGDFDNDGREDLAVVNQDSGDVSTFFNSCVAYNTQEGTNIAVDTINADFVFEDVTRAGTTMVVPIDPATAGDTPGGFAVADTAFEVTTTATFSENVTTCFQVPTVNIEADFNNLRVLHLEGTSLVDRTSSHDFAARTICATTTSFSPFYLIDVGMKARPLFDRSRAFKSGSTIPIKIQLLNSADQNVSASTAPLSVRALRRIGDATSSIVTDAGNANPDYMFRYDSGLQGYIYNLKTSGLAAGKYVLSFYAGSDRRFFYTVTFDIR